VSLQHLTPHPSAVDVALRVHPERAPQERPKPVQPVLTHGRASLQARLAAEARACTKRRVARTAAERRKAAAVSLAGTA
jgi:hypothetical protein